MKLIINGDAREVEGISSLPELIEALDLPAHSLLIEHNGVALHRREWSDRLIKEGDRLEFLRITAGG